MCWNEAREEKLNKVWGRWIAAMTELERDFEKGCRHWLTLIVCAWFVYLLNGGFARAEVVDEEEEFFKVFDI